MWFIIYTNKGESLSRLCLCSGISKHRPFSEPEVNAQRKGCQVGGQVGLHLGRGGSGEREAVVTREGRERGQGPKGDSTHGAARAEAGGLPQPSSAPPSRRPEAVAARDAGSGAGG